MISDKGKNFQQTGNLTKGDWRGRLAAPSHHTTIPDTVAIKFKA